MSDTRKFLDAVTSAPTTGPTIDEGMNDITYQATVTGTGAITATVVVEASNDGTNFLTLGTISLSGTTSASDGFAVAAAWRYSRARLTAISGTSAAVTCIAGF